MLEFARLLVGGKGTVCARDVRMVCLACNDDTPVPKVLMCKAFHIHAADSEVAGEATTCEIRANTAYIVQDCVASIP